MFYLAHIISVVLDKWKLVIANAITDMSTLIKVRYNQLYAIQIFLFSCFIIEPNFYGI